MRREALRPQNLKGNYLPPPLILSSPPSSPKYVKKQSPKHCIVGDHSDSKCTMSHPSPPPVVIQHWPVIISDVSLPTTEAPPAMLNLVNNYCSWDKAYIEQAWLITTYHSATLRKRIIKKSIQNLTDHSELPTFDHTQPVVHFQKAWNWLLILFSELDTTISIPIFNLFLTNSSMGQLVASTSSDTQQQLLGLEKERQDSWQPVTA